MDDCAKEESIGSSRVVILDKLRNYARPVSTTSTFWPNSPLGLDEDVVLPEEMAGDSSWFGSKVKLMKLVRQQPRELQQILRRSSREQWRE